MEIYPKISHLVQSVRVEPEVVQIEFASDCGQLHQVVTIDREPNPPDTGRQALGKFFRSTLRRTLGYPADNSSLPEEEEQSLVSRAFEQISHLLRYHHGKWTRAVPDEHPGESFDRQLRANPIVERYDVEVLVRVLLEVSRSDSEMRTEERAFLEEIVQDEETIKRLSQAPNITVAELAEASSIQVKETILMLAWAMAYADGHLDNEEMLRLNQLCRGFMLGETRVRELQMAAKLFLLDRHFQTQKPNLGVHELRTSFEEKAREWGLDDHQLQTLRSWYPRELQNDAQSG